MKYRILIPVLFVFSLTSCNEITAQKILAEKSFNLENIKSLDVRGKFCNIELNGTSGANLKMNGYIKGSGNPERYEIKYEKRGDHVEVWVETPSSVVWGNIQSLIEFEVPENVDIRIDNSSGNLKASNIKSRNINLETSSGNIEVEDIAGEMKINCSSGNVSVENQMGVTWITTTSGNIKIREVNGDAIIKASSGNININDQTGKMNARCTSGNITLHDLKGALTAETSSGNIKGDEILLNDDSEFRVTSGNIRLELLNNENDLSFDLEAGSGNLRAAGNTGEDHMIIKKGEIKISGISSSGNQTYITR